MVMLIPIVFYLYTSVSGKSIFTIDITTFIVAIVLGQFISYSIVGEKKLPKPIKKIAIAMLVALTLAFIVFTYYPPHLPIFQDSLSKGYGIIT
jgi:uncharacterized membrane protein YcaP (DUF421 family)